MSARLTIIAAAVLTIGTSALAEPARTEDHANQPANRPAAIVLASAETAQAPAQAVDQPTPPPAKRPRAARVTTCRCGDPQPEAQDQQ
jgi:hypothetical protein